MVFGLAYWGCEQIEDHNLYDCGGHDSWVTFDTEGGFAYMDSCGVCDDDPTNDCIEDCAGEWGGENICGCMDRTANNYDSTATYDDGTCLPI